MNRTAETARRSLWLPRACSMAVPTRVFSIHRTCDGGSPWRDTIEAKRRCAPASGKTT